MVPGWGKEGACARVVFPGDKVMDSQTKFCPLVRSQPRAGAGSGSVITRPTCWRVFCPAFAVLCNPSTAAGSRGMPLAHTPLAVQAPRFAQGGKSERKACKTALDAAAAGGRQDPTCSPPSAGHRAL